MCNNIPNRVKRASGVTIYEGKNSDAIDSTAGRAKNEKKKQIQEKH